MADLLRNNLGLQVLTDTGWSNFTGLLCQGIKKTVLVTTQSRQIVCTLDHNFFAPGLYLVEAQSLKPRSKIVTSTGIETVVSVSIAEIEPVYDLLEVEKNHRFYANNILAKNCEFIIYDETLINSIKLAEMQGVEPLLKAGQVRYYCPIDGTKTFVLAWDPSLGTGGDNAAVQVLQLPEMTQVAEWQHNKTDIKGQLKIIRDIIAYIDHEIKQQKHKGEIYWSVENNSIGEAALMAIREMGEENIPGIFLTEPGKQRRGFTTTFKVKISACAKLKHWVENDKIRLSSKNLIRELKTFVASGQSFAAKQGETDDLVMATVLCVRMIQLLVNWDQNLFDRLQDEAEKADIVMPMPIGIL